MYSFQDKLAIVNQSFSPYTMYCNGYGWSSGTNNPGYILGLVLGTGKDVLKFSHEGSSMLDEINAFDLAEVSNAYIGQLNMSIVSSFCGPCGLIWGLDLAFTDDLEIDLGLNYTNNIGLAVKIYSAEPLFEATKKLFGTVSDRRFNIIPGSHTPFAGKNIKARGPASIYSAIGIGITKDRTKEACLLMEDIGFIHGPTDGNWTNIIFRNLVSSVLQVGINQKVEYEKIYVGAKLITLKDDEIGCALVAAPYFTLAQDATLNMTPPEFLKVSLNEWELRYNKIYRS